MGRVALYLIVVFVAAGCARVSQPDSQINPGYPLAGQITKTSAGKLQLSFSDGLGFSCSGPYRSAAGQKSVTAPITCGDGRSGIAVVELSADNAPKTALLKFKGGSEEQAVFKPVVSFTDNAPRR